MFHVRYFLSPLYTTHLISVMLQATGYSLLVNIRNFVHKGLKWFYSEDSAKGIPPDTVDKLRKMFAYLEPRVRH